MPKNIREFLAKKHTSQDFTIEEVLEFTDSNIEYLTTEYEETIKGDEKATEARFCLQDLYSLIVDIKQLRDKLEEIQILSNLTYYTNKELFAELEKRIKEQRMVLSCVPTLLT